MGDARTFPASTTIGVRLRAIDVDGLAMNQTRAEIEIRFGNQTVPVVWTRGSNVYAAELSAVLTEQVGLYELVVVVNRGWSHAGENITRCKILHHSIEIVASEGFSTSWLLVGAACGSGVIVVVLLLVLRKWRKHLQGILMMLFTEVAELAGALMMECVDWITDVLTTYRVLHGEIMVSRAGYKIIYTMSICLGTVAMMVSVVYRVRNAQIVRKHVEALALRHPGDGRASKGWQQLQAFEWELEQTRRTRVVLCLALMTVVAEGMWVHPIRLRASCKFTFCCRSSHDRHELLHRLR
jgi:hypothetical protein